MQIDQTIFVKLMFGAFGLVIVAFTIRGLNTVVFGSETAQVIAAPVFVVAVLLAAVAFVLAVLVKLGIVDDGTETESNEMTG